MPLPAGKLRHRITIQSPVYMQDPETGEDVPRWVDLFTKVPAAIEPLSARELIAARATDSAITARIIIRYRPGLRAVMRILHKDSVYDVAGFIPDQVSGLEYLTIPVTDGLRDDHQRRTDPEIIE